MYVMYVYVCKREERVERRAGEGEKKRGRERKRERERCVKVTEFGLGLFY